jgi:serine/threonine protein kinase
MKLFVFEAEHIYYIGDLPLTFFPTTIMKYKIAYIFTFVGVNVYKMFLTPNSISNTNSQKVLISCETKNFITEHSLKMQTDYDKSRVILTYLEEYGQLIAKIGDNQSNLQKEYEIAQTLNKQRGYMRFLCFFKCTDDFMRHPNTTNNQLCKSNKTEKTMDVIIMPFYELGSIADYKWNSQNIQELKICIKQLLLFSCVNFMRYGFIHGDLHAKNILLNSIKSKQVYPIKYKINETYFVIKRSLFDIVIMDFENSCFDKENTNLFYIDLTKFFSLLSTFIKDINLSFVHKCIAIINSHALNLDTNFDILLSKLFTEIDSF